MINIQKKSNEIEQLSQDINNNPIIINPKNHQQQQQGKRKVEMTTGVVENGSSVTTKTGKEVVAGLSNEKALVDLMERTGYPLSQNNGQRRFGPPINFTGSLLVNFKLC